jgi:hypothetical protein
VALAAIKGEHALAEWPNASMSIRNLPLMADT